MPSGRTRLSADNLLHCVAGLGSGLAVVVGSDSVSPDCSSGEKWPFSHMAPTRGDISPARSEPLSGAGGASKGGLGRGVHAVCAPSPAAFTSNTFLEGNKPSARMEIDLESAIRLAGGFGLTKGVSPPPHPEGRFPCLLLKAKSKLKKTCKGCWASVKINGRPWAGRSYCRTAALRRPWGSRWQWGRGGGGLPVPLPVPVPVPVPVAALPARCPRGTAPAAAAAAAGKRRGGARCRPLFSARRNGAPGEVIGGLCRSSDEGTKPHGHGSRAGKPAAAGPAQSPPPAAAFSPVLHPSFAFFPHGPS